MFKSVTTRLGLALLMTAMLPLGQAMAQDAAPPAKTPAKARASQKMVIGKTAVGNGAPSGATAYRYGRGRNYRPHRHHRMMTGTNGASQWNNGAMTRRTTTNGLGSFPVNSGKVVKGNVAKSATATAPTKATKTNASTGGAKKGSGTPHNKAAVKQKYHNASHRAGMHARSHSRSGTTRHR